MRELEVLPEQKMMTLQCKIGNHTFQIPSRRGRPPHACDECRKTADLVALNNKSSEPEVDQAARLAYAREVKAQRAQERAARASEEQRAMCERIAQTLPNMHLMWNRSFTIACEVNTEAAWNKCETLLQSYVNAKRMVSNGHSQSNGRYS